LTFGRFDERAILDGLATAARAGTGRLALISGTAGIGKTDLAECAVAAWLASGGVAAIGRGVPVVGNRLPYLPWRHALAHPLAPASREISALLRDALRLLERPSDRERVLTVAAVWRALVSAADKQPLCIVLDDAQWVDASSLTLIAAGLPEVVRASVLVVVAARDSGLPPDSRLGAMFAEWERSSSCTHFRLDGLDVASMAEVVRRADPEVEEIDEVLLRAGGNPFFALSLLRSPRVDDPTLPDQLLDFLGAQLQAAGEHVERVVRFVAIAGEPIDLRVLSAAFGASELEVEDHVLRGMGHGLLRLKGDCVRVAHDLIADAAVHSIGPATRRDMHRAVAAAYERAGGGGRRYAAQRAAHWRGADQHEEALAASLEAAQDAVAVAAYPEQWQHLRLALDAYRHVSTTSISPHPPAGLLAEAAEAAYRAGYPADAVGLAEQALAQLGGSYAAKSKVLVRLVEYRRSTGDGRGAIAAARQAFQSLPKDTEPLPRSEVTSAYAAVLMAAGEYTAAAALAREALDLILAPAVSERHRAIAAAALTTLGVATALKGDVETGLAVLDDALSLAQQDGDKEAELRALNNRSFVLQAAGRHQAAAEDALEGLLLSRERHLDLGASAVLLANLVECLDWLGRWNEALAHLHEGLTQNISPETKACLRGTEAHIMAFRGNLPQAQKTCRTALAEATGTGMAGLEAQLAAIMADIALTDGAPEEALEVVTTALAALESSDEESETLPLAVLGMLSLHSCQHVGQSSSLFEAREGIAGQVRRVVGNDGYLSAEGTVVRAWRATYAAAELTVAGVADAEVWAVAANCWANLQHPLWQARCLIWTAEFEAATSRSSAASTLSAARCLAQNLGAQTLLLDIEALVRRANLPCTDTMPKPRMAGWADQVRLTPREKQVLALLMRGETNRRIARTLFITERTASVHVSNILRKLNSSNRGEAAAAAHRLKLVPTLEEA
jgi:DNA-binding CsgD family transcriptional regulator/predicted ATPase